MSGSLGLTLNVMVSLKTAVVPDGVLLEPLRSTSHIPPDECVWVIKRARASCLRVSNSSHKVAAALVLHRISSTKCRMPRPVQRYVMVGPLMKLESQE